MPICKDCTIANYLIEEAQYRQEDFTAGIIRFHNQCRGKGCTCGCKHDHENVLLRLWHLLHAR